MIIKKCETCNKMPRELLCSKGFCLTCDCGFTSKAVNEYEENLDEIMIENWNKRIED